MVSADSALVDGEWVEIRRYIGAWGNDGRMVIRGQIYTIN
jgi:hypothetical protein